MEPHYPDLETQVFASSDMYCCTGLRRLAHISICQNKRTKEGSTCQQLTISRCSEPDRRIRMFGAYCAKIRKCHESASPDLNAFTVMALIFPPLYCLLYLGNWLLDFKPMTSSAMLWQQPHLNRTKDSTPI